MQIKTTLESGSVSGRTYLEDPSAIDSLLPCQRNCQSSAILHYAMF